MNNCSIQKKFISIAMIFGVLFLMLIPPFQSPDEDSHFKKAYVMAEGNFFPDVVDGKEGYYLSETVINYIAEQLKSLGNTNYKFSYADILNEERTSVVYQDQVFTQFSTMSANPIAHIVPAMGIVLGKLTAIIAGKEPSIVFLLYFARFFSLLAYVVMVSVAIRMTPVLKKTFFMLGLMPMSLYLASSVSYDILVIGVSFLYTALCFKLLYEPKERVNTKQLIFIGFVAYVFWSVKIVYLPLLLLFLVILLEQRKWCKKDVKQCIRELGIVIGIFVFLLLVTTYLPRMFAVEIQNVSEEGISLSQQQIVFILKNPMEFFRILYQTIKSGRNYYVSSTIGMFGLVDTPMYSVYVYVYALFLGIIGISEISLSRMKIKWHHRLAVLLAVLASVFGMFLAMYIYWTPSLYGIGAKVIEGVQGRYFIALLPTVFLIFSNSFIRKNKSLRFVATECIEYGGLAAVAMLGVSGLTILLRYWV